MKTFMVACTVLMLSACSRDISTHSLVTPQAHITHSAQDIQNTTGMLYQADAINQVRSSLFIPRITANSQRISVDWDGDAIELLSQLAHQRGLSFAYTGVRLPLPLTLHVQDATFEQVLRLVRTQIDWRAQLDQQSTELRLYFMLPLKKGKLA
ncbi:DotD/TraH family lipoprotein [Serratia liquefaciens]